jgi:hypothetical protein
MIIQVSFTISISAKFLHQNLSIVLLWCWTWTEGDWGNEGTNGFVGAVAGAGVAGAGFAGALGAAAGEWAKVVVKKILPKSTKSMKKRICFILLDSLSVFGKEPMIGKILLLWVFDV